MDLDWFCCSSEPRKISQIPDWSESAIAGEHLWMPSSMSGDLCNVGDSECTVSEPFSSLPLIFPHVFHSMWWNERNCCYENAFPLLFGRMKDIFITKKKISMKRKRISFILMTQ